MKVSCHKCGQSRQLSNRKASFIWLGHSRYTPIMTKNEQNKWECYKGFGCLKEKDKKS